MSISKDARVLAQELAQANTAHPVSAETVIARLALACKAHPEQRVAQVIVNALGQDPFYLSNEEALKRLTAYS